MEIRSNILNKEITNKIIKETLKDISNGLANSLGPYGSNDIIEDKILNHVISKDGYTILNKFMYDNEVSQTVLEIIKKISRSLVREVGDGSTSSIIIANALFIEIDKILKNNKISPKVVLKVLKVLETVLTEEIKALAIPITEENFSKIEDIATVSNNNDKKLGKLISDLYKEIGADGFITLENSKTSEDYYVIKDGYEVPRGYIHSIFVNTANKIDVEFDKPFIFIANDTLREEDMEFLREMIGKVCGNLRSSLVIVAKDYDSEIANFLKINKSQNRQLNLVAIDYSLAKRTHRESMEDFATYLGATIYDKFNESQPTNFDISLLGRAEKVIITEKNSKFISGYGDKKEIQARIDLLEEQLTTLRQKDERMEMSDEIFNVQKRISVLSAKTATFYVGGNSEIEKENRKYLLEDSIFACQSTIRNGYIIGGNLIIPQIIEYKKEEIHSKVLEEVKDEDVTMSYFVREIIDAVNSSFLSGFETVLRNYKDDENYIEEVIKDCIDTKTIYNLTNKKYEDIKTTSIINSCSTDIEIMKATFSIIGLLATSNQFISRSIIRDEYYK